MATIRAFRGVRYNPARVPDLSAVISQPYDRVRYGLQEQYYRQSPYNVVRILRGRQAPGDAPDRPAGPNVYTRARATYDRWRAEGVLIREPEPALYAYHQTFTVSGERKTRKAFIAALELSPFEAGIVLPHEHTHAGPKEDRLRLLRSLQVNTGQIFMLYPDPQNRVTALLESAIAGRAPDMDSVEMHEADVQQQVWVVRDPEVLRAVALEMAPKRNLIIADGHHRYETALNYRDEQRPLPGARANYCMATLVGMDDPGLVILPTHRELFGLTGLSPADVLSRAETCFEITPVADLQACTAAMAEHAAPGPRNRHAFGLYAEGQYHLLVLNGLDTIERCLPGDRSSSGRSLDTAIAHKVILEGLAGLSERASEHQIHLRYHRDPRRAIDNVDRGEGDLVLLLNPTRIDQVKTCAEQGEQMPPKSTDFYPKMVAGLTMMPLSPQDEGMPSVAT
jgi:uncharacterized protein (DUF1015 family)